MTTPLHYQNFLASSATSSRTTSTSTGARAREGNKIQAFNIAVQYYEDNFRRKPPTAIQKDIAYRIADGMEPEVICAAIDETQRAPYPSWAYCLAILKRCDREQIRTMEDWIASRDRFTTRRGKPVDDLSWLPFFEERKNE